MAEKNSFQLEIAGLPFKLKTSRDEEFVQELVGFVDNRIKEAIAATKSGSYQSAAVLAALNIAEELISLKQKARTELDMLEHKAIQLVQDLEDSKVSRTRTI